jgi:hypothetical protein
VRIGVAVELAHALGSSMWERYTIGGSFKILDRETKAPAVQNPWFQPKPGVLQNSETALDRLLAKGTVMGARAVAFGARGAGSPETRA